MLERQGLDLPGMKPWQSLSIAFFGVPLVLVTVLWDESRGWIALFFWLGFILAAVTKWGDS